MPYLTTIFGKKGMGTTPMDTVVKIKYWVKEQGRPI